MTIRGRQERKSRDQEWQTDIEMRAQNVWVSLTIGSKKRGKRELLINPFLDSIRLFFSWFPSSSFHLLHKSCLFSCENLKKNKKETRVRKNQIRHRKEKKFDPFSQKRKKSLFRERHRKQSSNQVDLFCLHLISYSFSSVGTVWYVDQALVRWRKERLHCTWFFLVSSNHYQGWRRIRIALFLFCLFSPLLLLRDHPWYILATRVSSWSSSGTWISSFLYFSSRPREKQKGMRPKTPSFFVSLHVMLESTVLTVYSLFSCLYCHVSVSILIPSKE
jgi:hypothetical protein